jgi:hypothetical protein
VANLTSQAACIFGQSCDVLSPEIVNEDVLQRTEVDQNSNRDFMYMLIILACLLCFSGGLPSWQCLGPITLWCRA